VIEGDRIWHPLTAFAAITVRQLQHSPNWKTVVAFQRPLAQLWTVPLLEIGLPSTSVASVVLIGRLNGRFQTGMVVDQGAFIESKRIIPMSSFAPIIN
jgi:hypothetical protein